MRPGMEARGTQALLYFVVWMIVGHFVLLTLFLAILISNFTLDQDDTPEPEASGFPASTCLQVQDRVLKSTQW